MYMGVRPQSGQITHQFLLLHLTAAAVLDIRSVHTNSSGTEAVASILTKK